MSTTPEQSPYAAALQTLQTVAEEREAAGRHADAVQVWEQLATGLTGPARAPVLVRQAHLLAGPLKQPDEAERLYRRALTNDPANADALRALTALARSRAAWHLLANLHRRSFAIASNVVKKVEIAFEAGHVELQHMASPGGARSWFRLGLECDANNVPLLESLANLERDSANDTALLEIVESLIELQDEGTPVANLLEAAALRSDLGEHARALAYLQRASNDAPDDSLVLDALAEVLHQLDRYGDLADVLERRAAVSHDDPATLAIVMSELGVLFEERLFEPESALEAFERAYAADSTSPGVAEARTRLRAKLESGAFGENAAGEPRTPAQGQAGLEAALLAYEREAQVETDRSRLGILVGEIERIHEQRGTLEETLPWIQRWVAAAPEEPEALRALARIHSAPGHEGELTATLETLDPMLDRIEQVENRRSLGVLYARRGLPEEAARAFQSTVSLDPNDVEALKGLAAVLRELGRTEGLIAAQLQLADQLDSNRRWDCLYEISQLQDEIGDLSGAITTASRLEREKSSDEGIRERLDVLLERAGRFDELEERLLARSASLEAGSAEAVALDLRYAQLLESLSRTDEAADGFRRVLTHAPESREAIAGLERMLRSSVDASGLAAFLAEQASSAQDPILRDRATLERAVILDELLERSEEAAEIYLQIANAGASSELSLEASRRYEQLLENSGDWIALRRHLESSLEKIDAAEDERLHERLARVCADRLRDEEGELHHFERIVELNPTRADIWRNLAERYEQNDRGDDLVRALEAELEADTDHARELSLRARLAGIYAELLGKPGDAQIHYERVFELNPSHTAAAHFLAEHYQSINRPHDLIRVLEGRLAGLEASKIEGRDDYDGERTALRVHIAQVRESQLGDLESAISALEVALESAGPTSQVAEPLADCYQRAGYTLDLIDLCRNAIPSCEDGDERANWLVRLGDAFLSRELPRDAADAYRQVLTERPDDRAVQASLRELYRQQENPEPLARLLEAELSHLAGPTEIPVRLELAELLRTSLERHADALLHARRVLQIDPHHPTAFDLAMKLSEQTGQHDVALNVLDVRIDDARTRTESSELLTLRGRLYENQLGLPAKAADDFQRTLEFTPEDHTLRQELAALLDREQRWTDLLECLEAQARNAPIDARGEILERAAEIAWKHVSPDAALPWLERLRRLRPEDATIMARIADAHRRAGRLESQLRALATQAELTSDEEQRRILHLQRAALLESELSAPGRALAVLEAAAESSLGDEEILRHTERLQRTLGHHRKCAECLEALIALHPSNEIDLRRQLGELYASTIKDPEQAAVHWEAALSLVPAESTARIEILHALAESHRAANHINGWAQRSEEELTSLDPTPVFDDRRRELRCELALAYDGKLARPEQALIHLRALLDAGDEEFIGSEMYDHLERMCVQILRSANDPTELESRLSVFLEHNAEDVEHWLELARLREERLHSASSALAGYRRVLELDAHSLPALRGIRRTAERLGRWADVADAQERELEHPDVNEETDRAALMRRTADICWHRLQSTTRASRFYASALEVNAGDFAALRALERLLESMEDWRGALDLYESEVEVLGDDDPQRRREIWLHVADLAQDRTNEIDRALRALAKAAEIESLETPRLAELAELHGHAGDREAFAETLAAWCDAPDADVICPDHMRVAECLEELGRRGEAIDRIERGLTLDEGHAPAWDVAARLYEAADDHAVSADALRRAAECLPDSEAASRLLRAAQLLETDDPDAALAHLRAAVERDPMATAVHAARTRLAGNLGLFEEAEAAAGRALAADSGALDASVRAEIALTGGNAARQRGRLEAAAGFLARALEDAPDDDRITSAYGETLAELGDYASARSTIEARLARGDAYPERARHRAILGRCFEAKGSLDRALECYESALGDDSKLEEALCASVRVREVRGDVDEGIATLECWARAAEDSELHGERLLRAAEWEIRVGGRNASAERHLRDALAEYPRLPRAWTALVALYLEDERLDEAIECANRAALYIEDDSDLSVLALMQARAYEMNGSRLQATESYGVAAEADPRCVGGVLSQARLLRGAGEWRDASEVLESFVARYPDGEDECLANVLAQLGRLLAGPLEDVEGAVRNYRRAVTLSPEEFEPRAALAELLSHRPDDWEESLGHQRLLLHEDPANAAVLRVALRIARSRGKEAAVANGVHVLQALGIASAYETEEVGQLQPDWSSASDSTLADPLFERLRCVAREASREIATALGTPGDPEPAATDDPEVAFRTAALQAEGRLTAPALLPLPTREVGDVLELLATLILDPEQLRGEGRQINALTAALGRRRRKKLARILDGDTVDEIRSVDFEVWRSKVRALAAREALREPGHDLRIALVALVRENPNTPDVDLRERADISALVRGNATACGLLRYVVLDWVAQI